MKTTFGKIVGAQEALRALLKEPLAIGEAVALARLCRALDSELQLFESQRQKLLGDYGEKDAQGGVTIAPEKRPAFEKALRALLDVEAHVQLEKVTLTLREVRAAWVLDTEDFIEFREATT